MLQSVHQCCWICYKYSSVENCANSYVYTCPPSVPSMQCTIRKTCKPVTLCLSIYTDSYNGVADPLLKGVGGTRLIVTCLAINS